MEVLNVQFKQFSTKDGLVAGTSLSSTAIGMAAKLMQDMSMLVSRE